MSKEFDIPDEDLNVIVNDTRGVFHSGKYGNKLNTYRDSKIALLGAYLEGKISANLLINLTLSFHQIELGVDSIKDMLGNQYMVDYMAENHKVGEEVVRKQLRTLIKELDVNQAYANPWDNLDIVKSVNAHFRDNTFIRKFYRRHYRREDLINYINTEAGYYNEEIPGEDIKKVDLLELRNILSLAADIEISEDPLPVYQELQGILVLS